MHSCVCASSLDVLNTCQDVRYHAILAQKWTQLQVHHERHFIFREVNHRSMNAFLTVERFSDHLLGMSIRPSSLNQNPSHLPQLLSQAFPHRQSIQSISAFQLVGIKSS